MLETEDIPPHLRPSAQAALAWMNETRNSSYELTGLVGADEIASTEEPFELGLVLCDGEICAREQVMVQPLDGGFRFDEVANPDTDIPALLDPPVGLRRDWIQDVLKKHEFVLLLYYRGRW